MTLVKASIFDLARRRVPIRRLMNFLARLSCDAVNEWRNQHKARKKLWSRVMLGMLPLDRADPLSPSRPPSASERSGPQMSPSNWPSRFPTTLEYVTSCLLTTGTSSRRITREPNDRQTKH